MSQPNDFLAELKRRNVIRVAVVYAVTAFVVLQVADLMFARVGLPDWTVTLVVWLVVLGFPIALVLAWAFEVTPDGVRRAEPLPAAAGSAPQQRVMLILGIATVVVLLSAGLVTWYLPASEAGSEAAELTAATGAPLDRSIAVLPFANMSAEEENEYFADGMTEELLNALAKVDALKVAARTSSFAFKGRNVPVDSVARALRVAHVVEGSVRRDGDRVRITAQLIEAENGYHLWSESYDRELTDIFAVQEEIARAITDALQVRLAGGDTARLVNPPTDDLMAYELYLRGRHQWNLRSPAGIQAAIGHFEQALDRDPAYARAYAGLADAYSLLAVFGILPAEETYSRARSAAERALRLDPSLAEAHTSLAFIRMWHEFDWEGAGRGFRRALELEPNYATAHHWYAFHLLLTGRTDEAVRQIQRASEIDPLSPAIEDDVWHIRYFARQYDEVIAHMRSLPADHPALLNPFDDYLPALVERGLHEQAIAELRRLMAAQGDPNMAGWLAYPYARMGRRAEALQLLKPMLEEPLEGPFQIFVVHVYAALGDQDRAFEWLDRAYEQRNSLLSYLKVDPALDPLRSDPRFTAMLQKMGLE